MNQAESRDATAFSMAIAAVAAGSNWVTSL
jgi:hypothetical protein